jgi:hypothetical protein
MIVNNIDYHWNSVDSKFIKEIKKQIISKYMSITNVSIN